MSSITSFSNTVTGTSGTPYGAPMGSLSLPLSLLKNGNSSQRIQAIAALESIGMAQPASIPMIVIALKDTIYDDQCSKETHYRCITGLKTFIPYMQLAEIKTTLSLGMNLLGDYPDEKEIVNLNTYEMVKSLLETDVNALFPLLLEDLKEIFGKTGAIYTLRDEKTIRCGIGLLKIISKTNIDAAVPDTLVSITEGLINAWIDEKDRHEFGGQSQISPDLWGEVFYHLSAKFYGNNFVEFLIDVMLEWTCDDFKDKPEYKILLITEAALNALLKNPSLGDVQNLIDILDEGKDNWSYNVIWLLGEAVNKNPNIIPVHHVPRLVRAMCNILDTANYWIQALHAAEALGKMGPLFDEGLEDHAIQALERGLLGAHNISDVSMVQPAAAQALGKIGRNTTPQSAYRISKLLIENSNHSDYDVRHSIVTAIRELCNVIHPVEIPQIFTAFTNSLSDEDAKVRKAAAKALEAPIKSHPSYASTQLSEVLKGVQHAVNVSPKTNPKKWESAQCHSLWILKDMALIFPVWHPEHQMLRKELQSYATISPANVKDTAKVILDELNSA